MHTPEKRRGGSHVLRAGVSQASRQHSHATGRASGSHHSNESTVAAAAASSNKNSTMPALPPRAAMVSNSIGASEDPHESSNNNGAPVGGGPLLAENDNDGSGATSTGPGRHGSKDKRKERERESALLREKDDRITYLENEMDIMEHEFQRELDKLSQNESETATFWQAKHSALNQQYLRTDTELRLLRAELDVREAEREELRQGWEVLRQELKERDDDIRSLRSQIRGLKEFVSTSTRTDGQTSDEVFGDGMAKLGNGLQNWVITNFRRAKLGRSTTEPVTKRHRNEISNMLGTNSALFRGGCGNFSRTRGIGAHVRRACLRCKAPSLAVCRLQDSGRHGL